MLSVNVRTDMKGLGEGFVESDVGMANYKGGTLVQVKRYGTSDVTTVILMEMTDVMQIAG